MKGVNIAIISVFSALVASLSMLLGGIEILPSAHAFGPTCENQCDPTATQAACPDQNTLEMCGLGKDGCYALKDITCSYGCEEKQGAHCKSPQYEYVLGGACATGGHITCVAAGRNVPSPRYERARCGMNMSTGGLMWILETDASYNSLDSCMNSECRGLLGSICEEHCVNQCDSLSDAGQIPFCMDANTLKTACRDVNGDGCTENVTRICPNGCEGAPTTGQCKTATGASCSDGIKNGDETGIDCGGSCAPCSGGNAGSTCLDSNPCSCCNDQQKCSQLAECQWKDNACKPTTCGRACTETTTPDKCISGAAYCASALGGNADPCPSAYPFSLGATGDCSACCVNFQSPLRTCEVSGGGGGGGAAICGNGQCEKASGENCETCQPDCGICPNRKPACRDGKDNDHDGKIDFPSDPGCRSLNDRSEKDPVQTTSDPDSSKAACEAAGFDWIGPDTAGSCCGNKAPEYFTVWQSDFNPAVVNFFTGCWDDLPYNNNQLAVQDTVLNHDGAFLGCKVADSTTLSLPDTLHGGQVVKQNLNYCANNGGYYCSYANIWKAGISGMQHTTPKSLPQGSAAQVPTDCCPASYCWTGSECVSGTVDSNLVNTSNQSDQIVTHQFGNGIYACSQGAWVGVAKKYNWDFTESSYCPLDECYYSMSGENPGCVKDGFWKFDYLCEQGNWTTRTKQLAMQLVSLAGQNDFTLFCDKVTNAANKYAYADSFPGGQQAFNYFFGQGALSFTNSFTCDDLPEGIPCANNLCAIEWSEAGDTKVAVGAALNLPIDHTLDMAFLNLFPESRQSTSPGHLDFCDQAAKDSNRTGDYYGCNGKTVSIHGSPANLWYNGQMQSIIYSSQENVIVGHANIGQLFLHFIKNPIQRVVSFISSLFRSSGDDALAYIDDKVTLFNTLYVSAHGDKAIRGTTQLINESTFLTVDYVGYTIDLCRAMNEYCDENRNNPRKSCFSAVMTCQPHINGDTTEYSITTQNYDAFWQDLTARTRNADERPKTKGGTTEYNPEIVLLDENKVPITGTYPVGKSMFLHIVSPPPPSIISYTWDLGETQVGSQNSTDQIYAYRDIGSYRVHLVAVDDNFQQHTSNTIPLQTTPNCGNQVMDGDETGVDCGGSCAPCTPTPNCGDGACGAQEDCTSCTDDCGVCGSAHACNNGKKDGQETGVDCGSVCSKTCSTATVSGPLRILTQNPRYFTNDGANAVYLNGYYWGLEFNTNGWGVEDINFDAYLNFLKNNNLNHIRLWIVESTRGDSPKPLTTPMSYLRTGPGNAKDGGSKFDLTKFDPAFFNRLRERVSKANEKGIYVSILLFDKWSAQKIVNKAVVELALGHPYAQGNNINGVDGDPNGNAIGTRIRDSTYDLVFDKQKAYVQKVIDTVNDFDNVLYEIANEEVQGSKAWQYSMIDFIHDYEKTKPKQHPVGMSEFNGGTMQELLSSNADYIEPPKEYADSMPVNDGTKVIILDTDHLNPGSFTSVDHTRDIVWKGITRGHSMILLGDVTQATKSGNGYTPLSDIAASAQTIARVRPYLNKVNLAAMVPTSDAGTCSTTYCMTSPNEYLVYLPNGGAARVNLAAAPGTFDVEWYNPRTGQTSAGGTVGGGTSQAFAAPGVGDWVLYLKKEGYVPPGACTDGRTQACTTQNGCTGMQTCTGAVWGVCVKTDPQCGTGQNSCSNGVMDNGEYGVDCGGPCPFCTNDLDKWKCKDPLSGQAASSTVTWNFAGPIVPTKDDGGLTINQQIGNIEPLKFYKKMTIDFDMHVADIKLRISEGNHKYDGTFSLTRSGGGKSAKYANYWQVLIKDGTQTSIYWTGEHDVPQQALATAWKSNMDYHVTAVFDAVDDTLALTLTDKKTNNVVNDLLFPSVYPISSDIADAGNGLFLAFTQNADWKYSNIHVTLEPGGPFWGGVRKLCS